MSKWVDVDLEKEMRKRGIPIYTPVSVGLGEDGEVEIRELTKEELTRLSEGKVILHEPEPADFDIDRMIKCDECD